MADQLLPGWVLLVRSHGIPLGGYVRETTVGGARFLELLASDTPGAKRLHVINAAQVTAISPLEPDAGCAAVARQWAGAR